MSDRKVIVPGCTSVVGGTIVDGVGLATANGVAEADARVPCGPGAVQALRAMARIAPAARLPLIPRFRCPAARPGRVIVRAKISDLILRPRGNALAYLGAA